MAPVTMIETSGPPDLTPSPPPLSLSLATALLPISNRQNEEFSAISLTKAIFFAFNVRLSRVLRAACLMRAVSSLEMKGQLIRCLFIFLKKKKRI